MTPKRTFTTRSGTEGGQLAERHKTVRIVIYKPFAKRAYMGPIEAPREQGNRPYSGVSALAASLTPSDRSDDVFHPWNSGWRSI